ncbi:hypothetical protein AMTR_s00004p00261980 [Amborella trichopoda]|uniref:C3H1-type domain-containing protein n=2 Tax=Amborella trichopoda TaxID=13333 RepID=W1NDL6_AMBTC|nr:hypothetical protein AMTR_s00004p00261980 [Amborella trichopoda]
MANETEEDRGPLLPRDAEMRRAAEELACEVSQRGIDCEDRARFDKALNPAFAFLFDAPDPNSDAAIASRYYSWLKKTYQCRSGEVSMDDHEEEGQEEELEEEEGEEEEEELEEEGEELEEEQGEEAEEEDNASPSPAAESDAYHEVEVKGCEEVRKVASTDPSDKLQVKRNNTTCVTDQCSDLLDLRQHGVYALEGNGISEITSDKGKISRSLAGKKRSFGDSSWNEQQDNKEAFKGTQVLKDDNHDGVAGKSSFKSQEMADSPTSSNDSDSDGVLYSKRDLKALHTKPNMGLSEDLKLECSSLHVPPQRLRSRSPDAEEFGGRNKRSPLVCDFFARGWCIKGSSCKFLHQKDDVNEASQVTKGKTIEAMSWRGDTSDGAGERRAVDTSKYSIFSEQLSSSQGVSLTHSLAERSQLLSPQGDNASTGTMFRKDYGSLTSTYDGFHPLNFPGERSRFVSSNLEASRENPRQDSFVDNFRPIIFDMQDRHFPPISIGGDLQCYDRPSVVPSIHEKLGDNMYQRIPKGEYNHNSTFLSRYPSHYVHGDFGRPDPSLNWNRSNPASLLAGLSMPLVGDDGRYKPFKCEGNSLDLTIPKWSSRFSMHDVPMPGLNSFLRTSFSSNISYTNPAITGPGSSSTIGSPFSVFKLLDSPNIPNSKARSFLPCSFSMTGKSPPYGLRPEGETTSLQNIEQASPIPGGSRTYSYSNSRELSGSLRSSFSHTMARFSSPSSQYDPILDSIEPSGGEPHASFVASSFSESKCTESISQKLANGNRAMLESWSPGYNAKTDMDSFYRVNGDRVDIQKAETAEETPLADAKGTTSEPKEDKKSNPNVAAAGHAENAGDSANAADGNRHDKDSKLLKCFRAALVDFVKELLKPFWREGRLSKDAHKTVVKKAVEKVLSAMHPNQIPGTTESINQYLSTSRTKIRKLVEGYVAKYAKS